MKILLFKTYITSILLKPYEAFKAGCVWKSIKTDDKGLKNGSRAISICSIDNLPDLQSEIYKPIDDEIKECSSPSSVKTNLEAWIDDSNNVHSGQSLLETKMAIEGVMKDRFPWMDFMLLVYTELHGANKHWVHNNLHKFRYKTLMIIFTPKNFTPKHPPPPSFSILGGGSRKKCFGVKQKIRVGEGQVKIKKRGWVGKLLFWGVKKF